MERRGTLIAMALLVGGCAPHWTRPDPAGAAWADQDETACQQQAEFLTSPLSGNFYGSLMEMYGQNFRPMSRRQPQWVGSPGPTFDIDPVRRTLEEDRLVDACMRAKGYTPVN
jgi:hypothetical protein